MSILDWVLLAIVLLLSVRCLVRGFVREVSSAASWAAGIVAALLLHRWVGGLLASLVQLGGFAPYAGFALAFLAGFLAMRLLGRLVREGLEAARLDAVDKALGFLLGAVEGAAAVALILFVLEIQPLFDAKTLLEGSTLAQAVLPVVSPALRAALKPIIESTGPGGTGPNLPVLPTLPSLLPPKP